jgi:hypothetical protein
MVIRKREYLSSFQQNSANSHFVTENNVLYPERDISAIPVLMLTKEDLHQIGELLAEERNHTRNIVKNALEANNRIIGTIIRAELFRTESRTEAHRAKTR